MHEVSGARALVGQRQINADLGASEQMQEAMVN